MIPRFDFIQPDNWHGFTQRAYMELGPDGNYVLFDDHAIVEAERDALKIERDELKAKLDNMMTGHGMTNYYINEYAKLQAEYNDLHQTNFNLKCTVDNTMQENVSLHMQNAALNIQLESKTNDIIELELKLSNSQELFIKRKEQIKLLIDVISKTRDILNKV